MSHTDIQNSFLIKFVKHEFSADIMDGRLYCNSIDYFRNLKDAGGQEDRLEGIAWYYPDYNDKTKAMKIELNGEDNCLFCMFNLAPLYVFDSGGGHYKLTELAKEKFRNFSGTTENELDCIVILKPDEFIIRTNKSLSTKYIPMSMMNHACEYVLDKTDPNEMENNLLKNDHSMAGFIKNKEYEWQEEYRFLFSNTLRFANNNGAVIIELEENIKDIAYRVEYCFRDV